MNAHRRALVLATGRSDAERLRRAVRLLRSEHARVYLAAIGQPVDRLLEVGADEVHDLVAAAQPHGPAFRRSLQGSKPAERLWLHLERDEWVSLRLDRVSTVMAADAAARSSVERLGMRKRHLEGLDPSGVVIRPAQTDVAEPAEKGRNRTSGPVRGLLRLRRLRNEPSTLDREASQPAQRSVAQLLRAGNVVAAEERAREAAGSTSSLRERADLLGDVTSWSLAHGRPTTLALETYAAELAVADEHLRSGDVGQAVQSWMEAVRTAFHPVLHFDSSSSPLAEDPTAFTAPLRDSAVAARLSGRGENCSPMRRTPSRASSSQRPTRLLLATQHNADFLDEIRRHFTQHPDFETRFEVFQDSEAVNRFVKRPEALVRQLLTDGDALRESLEQTFRRALDWADVVFVEWSTGLAALLSHMDTTGTRIVVRLHSYEVFTHWPQITDFSNVDDLVFVSDHLRDLAVATIPALEGPRAPRLHVIPNAMHLQRFARPKADDARFTLGVVGASKGVKDPRWAIEVVRQLRKHDDRYRLHLLRATFQVPNEAARAYADALQRDLDELEPRGAVVRLKHTDDVPTALEPIGVVLSSSLRESFHMGLVEGAASGALPVVRDWPFFPGAARRLFPEEWVVSSPEEAADRIRRHTAEVDVWRRSTSESSRHVLERWDWTVVRDHFERLLRED